MLVMQKRSRYVRVGMVEAQTHEKQLKIKTSILVSPQ